MTISEAKACRNSGMPLETLRAKLDAQYEAQRRADEALIMRAYDLLTVTKAVLQAYDYNNAKG